jgi:hypothetical protein
MKTSDDQQGDERIVGRQSKRRYRKQNIGEVPMVGEKSKEGYIIRSTTMVDMSIHADDLFL